VDAPLRKVLQDYTKRISGKIAALESSIDGELAEDEMDDEREIASVGGMAFWDLEHSYLRLKLSDITLFINFYVS
jgi:hypothetical protein